MMQSERADSSGAVTIVLALLLFAGLSLTCAVLSDGFVTADACTHYLYARFVFSDPINLVDVWARPFCTALYAVPARFGGRLGVRATALLIAIGCALVAWRISRGQRDRWPVLALVLTLGQPLLFVHSFSEMTELPFALLLGWAFLAYQQRRYALAALLAGLTPTARPEGFGFVLLAGLALALQKRWQALLLLPLPLAAWDIGGWILTNRPGPLWRWLIDAWPWSTHGLYGSGSAFTYLAELPIIVSPLILPATIIGISQSFRSIVRVREESQDLEALDERKDLHLSICRAMTAVIPLFVLAVHTLLRARGTFGSFGEPRYLLVVAPFWGVLSARGWEWVFSRLNWKHPVGWASVTVLFPVLINVIHPAVPIHLGKDWQKARRFAQWYQGSDVRRSYPTIIAAHPGIFFFLDRDPNVANRTVGFTRGTIEHPPARALLVWDPEFSRRNANVEETATLDAIRHAGWLPDLSFDELLNGPVQSDSENHWHVFRSPSVGAAHPGG